MSRFHFELIFCLWNKWRKKQLISTKYKNMYNKSKFFEKKEFIINIVSRMCNFWMIFIFQILNDMNPECSNVYYRIKKIISSILKVWLLWPLTINLAITFFGIKSFIFKVNFILFNCLTLSKVIQSLFALQTCSHVY